MDRRIFLWLIQWFLTHFGEGLTFSTRLHAETRTKTNQVYRSVSGRSGHWLIQTGDRKDHPGGSKAASAVELIVFHQEGQWIDILSWHILKPTQGLDGANGLLNIIKLIVWRKKNQTFHQWAARTCDSFTSHSWNHPSSRDGFTSSWFRLTDARNNTNTCFILMISCREHVLYWWGLRY